MGQSKAIVPWAAVLAASIAWACASTNPDAPLRSPTQDYPPPPPRESDGRTMGADNIPPGERLEQGARAGTDNELAPGWELDEQKRPRFDPEQRKGGAIDTERRQEPAK